MTLTFTHSKTKETIEYDGTREQLLAEFLESAEPNHWTWYWLAQTAKQFSERHKNNGSSVLKYMFAIAHGYGLKRPKIKLHYSGSWYTTKVSRFGNIGIYVDTLFMGSFRPNFVPSRDHSLTEQNRELLDHLHKDPVNFIAACGRDVDSCCYCNQPLSDGRSKSVGYGRTCAGRFGLPWGEEKGENKAPIYAHIQESELAQRLLDEAMKGDTTAYALMGDWLEEIGYPQFSENPTAWPGTNATQSA